jgi:hypothetical protein
MYDLQYVDQVSCLDGEPLAKRHVLLPPSLIIRRSIGG